MTTAAGDARTIAADRRLARAEIQRFVRRLGSRRRAVAAAHALVRRLPAGLALLLVVDWIAGAWLLAAGLAVGGWWAFAAAWAFARGGVRWPEADAALQLRDELATWASVRRRALDTPAVGWLERDLSARLRVVPAAALRRLGWRPLGRARRWAGVVALIVLLRLLAPWLPLPDGVLDLAGRGPSATEPGSGGGASAPGPGDGSAGASGATEPEPDAPAPDAPAPDAPAPDEPEREQPPDPAPDADAEPSGTRRELPPETLIAGLPVDEGFALPKFVADGPSREAEAHVADLPRGGDRGAGEPPPATGGDRGDAPDDPGRESELRDYRRAAERALRSRHVPEHERPFVRRYFAGLLESGR